MSRTSQRPTVTFRSARRVTVEAPDAKKPELSERQEEARALSSAGHYGPGKGDRRLGRTEATIDGSIYNNSSSNNSNNNNCNIKVINSSRKEEYSTDWDSKTRVSRYNPGNTITCGESNIRVKNISGIDSGITHTDARTESFVASGNLPTQTFVPSGNRTTRPITSVESDHHTASSCVNIGNRGNNTTISDSTLRAKTTNEENTTENTTSSTTLTTSKLSTKPEPAKTGVDSSNNNKVITTRTTSDACIVDNLIIEPNQVEPKPCPESTATTEIPASTNTKDNKKSSPPVREQADESQAANDVAFSDPRQSQVFQMLTGVQKLRQDTTFADLTIKINDTEFRCHRFVLAINSPYFSEKMGEKSANKEPTNPSKLSSQENAKDKETPVDAASKDVKSDQDKLTNSQTSEKEENVEKSQVALPLQEETKEQATKQECMELTGLQPDIFSKILDFMYCQFEGVLTEENCLDLLLAAHSFQLHHLRRTCATFVTDSLSPSNVFQVLALWDAGHASLFEPRVIKQAHQVIRENFAQLSSVEDFLRVSRHVMIPLMADSMLHIRSEMEVLQALLRWVRARPEERCSDMTLMLQHVRFPLMSSRELEKLRDVPILQQNSLAMALIDESRAYGNLDYNERMAWPRHNSISRCLFSTRDLIMWTADRDKGLHFYSVIDGQHHKVTSFGELTSPPSHSSHPNGGPSGNFSFDSTSSVCCYGDKIFFTGGEFNTDMVWSVDTSSGEVTVHAKMPRGRKFHSMVASKGCVYCLGGQDKRGYTVLEDVDAYIINKDMWVKVGHLAVPAYNMSAAVSGGAIYLVGGLDYAGQPLRLIQCFISLRSGLYSAFKVEINNMPPSLLSARAVSCGLDKSIYIVCGHGEVYQFEPDRQSVSHLTTLRNLSENPRVRFGLAYMGGCLVVIGGHQLGHVLHEPIRSVCLDIASKTEVRDYSPLLPGDIVNTCLAAKLSSNILRLFRE